MVVSDGQTKRRHCVHCLLAQVRGGQAGQNGTARRAGGANANGCLRSLSMGREIALLGGVLTASGSNKCQGSDWLPFEDRLVGGAQVMR